MKVVSLIPARKGSKGIPNENLIDLCGKPLIYYSIKASKKSLVEETWVSSDSDEILEISKNYGAKTIKRPSEPIFSAYFDNSIASDVEFEPVPAITGIFPLLSFTAISMTLLCSSLFKVGDSPVVPAGTRPLVPFLIW